MAILTLDTTLMRLAQLDFALNSLTAMSPRSTFNNFTVTSGPVSEFWMVNATFIGDDATYHRPLRALLFALRGGLNKLRLFDKSSETLQGAGGASPTVNIGVTGVAGDETVTLKNLVASQAVALAADDKIGIGENLHVVTANAGSDGSGNATVSILPALRLGVAVDDPVNLLRPTGLFRLMSPPSIIVGPPTFSQPATFQFMEDPDLG